MRMSFKAKIYMGLFSLLFLFGAGAYFAASKILREAVLEENRTRGLVIARSLTSHAVEPILAMDFLRLKNLVDEVLLTNRDVLYAFITNARGEVLVHTFQGGFPVELRSVNLPQATETYSRILLDTGADLVYDYALPVSIEGNRFGTVRIGLLQTGVQQAIKNLSQTMFFATALFLMLSGLLGAALARNVGKRVETLHRSIDKVLRGDLDVQTSLPLKKNCWDFTECRNEQCPAYNEPHIRCWYLAGTLCPQCDEGKYSSKIVNCASCAVYKTCSGDEIQKLADSFDFMVRTLKNHLADLKAVEDSLTAQQALLKTILNATPDFVTLQDRDSVYMVVNKAFCDFVGRDETNIIGKCDADLFGPQRAESNRKEDLEVLQSGNPLVKEDKIRIGNTTRWIHLVKLPVRDNSGNVTGLLCSGRDITDLKTFQDQLYQAQKMETIGQMTAGIAHEINTPLGIILGYSQLLLEDAPPGSDLHNDLKTIEKHTRICRKIVADLLRFSRHTESALSPVDVNRAVEDIVSVVQHTFGLERVMIVRKLAPQLPNIVGDEEKIRQALVNLLNNARDAIGSDGIIQVSTGWDSQTGMVHLSVADTGEGIPAHRIDKIFDPFFTTKSVGKGTGLGLSVTFGIARDHGGSIDVQSPLPPEILAEMLRDHPEIRPGKGSVFTLSLPSTTPREREPS